MVNYPEYVKIGGISYEIKITNCLTLGSANCNAEIDYTNCEIRITDIPNQDKRNVALMHEIVHGLFIQQGVIDQDETLIERIAQSLYGFIKDNPKLISALLPQEEPKLNLSLADIEAAGKLINNFPNVVS